MRHLLGILLLAVGLFVGARMFYPETASTLSHSVISPAEHSIALLAFGASRARPVTPAEASPALSVAEFSSVEGARWGDAPGRVALFSPGSRFLAAIPYDSNASVTSWVLARRNTRRPELVSGPVRVTKSSMGLLRDSASNRASEVHVAAVTTGWKASVAFEPGVKVVGGRPVAIGKAQIRSERELAVVLQRELARVGCYAGRVDGVWGPASEYAAISFMKAVNASLPRVEPNIVLLWLARSQPRQVCRHRPIVANKDGGVRGRTVGRVVAMPLPVRRPAIAVARAGRQNVPLAPYSRMGLGASAISQEFAGRETHPTALDDAAVTVARRTLDDEDLDFARPHENLVEEPGTAVDARDRATPEAQKAKKHKSTKAKKRRKKRRYSRKSRRIRRIFENPLHNLY